MKLKHEAEVQHLRLEKELDIREFIKSVAHVDNYKTILKSVKILNEKQAAAEKLGVKLDNSIVSEISQCNSRLISERNLRFQMDNISVPKSDHEAVSEMESLIKKATDTAVADEYLEQGNKLSQQMSGNIKAREILKMLLDYPERVYPDPVPLDAKGKPIKQKEDPKKKPKRKKKEPPFPTPDWALEIEAVEQ
mgnify:CR=1 FL=1